MVTGTFRTLTVSKKSRSNCIRGEPDTDCTRAFPLLTDLRTQGRMSNRGSTGSAVAVVAEEILLHETSCGGLQDMLYAASWCEGSKYISWSVRNSSHLLLPVDQENNTIYVDLMPRKVVPVKTYLCITLIFIVLSNESSAVFVENCGPEVA